MRRYRFLLAGFLLVASGTALASCAAPKAQLAPYPQWPAAPFPPRILFRGSLPVATPHSTSWLLRAWHLFAGIDTAVERAQSLVQPHGVVAHAGHLWIADPGGAAVWRYEMRDDELVPLSCQRPFASPVALALSGDGKTLFIADSRAGSLLAMHGDEDCTPWGEGQLLRPTGLAWVPQHSLLAVTDVGLHEVLVFDASGQLVRTIGGRGENDAGFNFPTHVAADSQGRLFVVDAMNYRIKILDADSGELLGSFGQAGDVPGLLSKPKGIALDSQGHIYVADAMQDRVFIFDDEGQFLLDFGSSGNGPGELSLPGGVAIDERDQIFVADGLNHRVQAFQYVDIQAQTGAP